MYEASRLRCWAEASAAWKLLGTGEGWEVWLAVGRGLQDCQTLALELAQSNDMKSQKAKKEMAKLLDDAQLADIDKSVRSDLLAVMRDLPAIIAWRDNVLTLTERMEINHPKVVMRRFKKATMPPPPKPPVNGSSREPAGLKGFKAAYQAAMTAVEETKAENRVLKQRLKTKGGSPFDWTTDTPDNMARAAVDSLDRESAERMAQAMLHLLLDPQPTPKTPKPKTGGRALPARSRPAPPRLGPQSEKPKARFERLDGTARRYRDRLTRKEYTHREFRKLDAAVRTEKLEIS